MSASSAGRKPLITQETPVIHYQPDHELDFFEWNDFWDENGYARKGVLDYDGAADPLVFGLTVYDSSPNSKDGDPDQIWSIPRLMAWDGMETTVVGEGDIAFIHPFEDGKPHWLYGPLTAISIIKPHMDGNNYVRDEDGNPIEHRATLLIPKFVLSKFLKRTILYIPIGSDEERALVAEATERLADDLSDNMSDEGQV